MKHVKIAVIIMAAIVVAAVGIFLGAKYINDKNQDKKTSEDEQLMLFGFNSDDVDKMEIENDGGKYTAVYEADNGWVILEDNNFKLNETAISNAAINMSTLKASEIISDGDTDKYGFDDPIKLTAYTGEKSYTLLVGKVSPTKEYYYVMKEDDDNVYLVDYSKGISLDVSKDALKSVYPYSFSTFDITHFALWEGKESDENILFSMNKGSDDKWSMDKPFKDDSVYSSDVDKYLTSVTRDQVSGFLQENCSEADYPKYGFDDPRYVFEISTADETVKVIFGSNTSDGTSMYALYTHNGQVVTFAANSVTALGSTTLDMVDPLIFSPEKEEIDTVEVTAGEEKITLDLSSEEFLEDADVVIDDEESSETTEEDKRKIRYITLFDSFNNIRARSIDRKASPQNAPSVTIVYNMKDGSKTEISYIRKDDDNSYALKNGEYTGFTVNTEYVDNIPELIKELEK